MAASRRKIADRFPALRPGDKGWLPEPPHRTLYADRCCDGNDQEAVDLLTAILDGNVVEKEP
jgi:hypothetical protein